MKKKILIGLFLSAALITGFIAGKFASESDYKKGAENSIETFTEEELEELEKVEALAEYEEGSLEFYQQLVENLEVIEVYDSSELTLEDLQNRNGKIIIEKCIGVVTSPEGDGKVLNYQNPEYYYINYSRMEDIKVGTVVLTYFIYNPDNNVEDDILYRFDYIIDEGGK